MDENGLLCKCGGEIIEDDCYDTSHNYSTIVHYMVGHCEECGQEYQWKEYYEYEGMDSLEAV